MSEAEFPATKSSASSSGPDQAVISMPSQFQAFLLANSAFGNANYTVLLLTGSAYAQQLGGNAFFTGLLGCAPFVPSIFCAPLVTVIFRRGYKPVLFLNAILNIGGNILYALGEQTQCRWLLLIGHCMRALFFGLAGSMLARDCPFVCASPSKRSGFLVRFGNFGFLGLGLGPVLAAMFVNVRYRNQYITVDKMTMPGWFFAAVWLCMTVWLIVVPEPARPFEVVRQPPSSNTAGNEKAARSPASDRTRRRGRVSISWLIVAFAFTFTTFSIWEATVVYVTRAKFGWDRMSASVYLGGIFITCMVVSEGLKSNGLLDRFHEAHIISSCLLIRLVGSLMLFWFWGPNATKFEVISNEAAFTVGSVATTVAINFTRSCTQAIAMRTALRLGGASTAFKVNALTSVVATLFQGAGAFIGMALPLLPHGPMMAAGIGIVDSAACLALLFAVPGLRQALKSA